MPADNNIPCKPARADSPKFYVSVTGGILLDLCQVEFFHNGRTLPGKVLVPLLREALITEGKVTVTPSDRETAPSLSPHPEVARTA
jgi:hypothetical protein